MARKSFIDRVQPNRMRSKLIAWPFEAEGEDKPRVRIKVLGAHELEAANLAMHDHFKAIKRDVKQTMAASVAREHVELVWRAYADDEGQPLTDTAAELAKEPAEIIDALYGEWDRFQGEVAATPLKQSDLDELIAGLKKNTQPGLLDALPSTWLRQLVLTLVSPPPTSTTESAPT